MCFFGGNFVFSPRVNGCRGIRLGRGRGGGNVDGNFCFSPIPVVSIFGMFFWKWNIKFSSSFFILPLKLVKFDQVKLIFYRV